MGLADKVKRQQQANAQAESLKERWGGFDDRTSPVVETPHGELAVLIKEALPLLRFTTQYHRGRVPDGSERLKRNGVGNSAGIFVTIAANADNDRPEFGIAIFPDGRFAWTTGWTSRPEGWEIERYGTAGHVESGLIKFIASGQ